MEMTDKEIRELEHGENSYGVYSFKIDDKSVLNAILNINERYPDDTMVAVNTNVYALRKSCYMFDLAQAEVVMYYRQKNSDLACEMESNPEMHMWCDTDCFDLEGDVLARLKSETPRNRKLILSLMQLNNVFVNMLTETKE